MSKRDEIIEIAKSQLDYREGPNNDTKYGDWYGMPNQPWCAMFVSWCANQVGISSEVIQPFAYCPTGYNWFRNKGEGTRDHIRPEKGDIIFFIWSGNSTPDHVGLVEYVEGDTVHTIEGNRSDRVGRFTYNINAREIFGYGKPNYGESSESDPQQQNAIEQVEVRVNTSLNIREGAGTEYPVVGSLYNGDVVDIYEKQGNWGRCNRGWICLDYTKQYSNESHSDGYVLGLYKVDTPSGLNVRKGAGTNYGIIKTYPNGTRFDTYEIKGNWARTPSGWVCLDYCKLINAY